MIQKASALADRYSGKLSKFIARKGQSVAILYLLSLFVGLMAVGFAWLADTAFELNQHLFETHRWLALALPPIVFPLSLWLVNVFFWGSGGSGIPQAVKVVSHPKPRMIERLLGWRALAGKILLTPFVIASGAAAGREGPTVQIGAAIMAMAHRIPVMKRSFDLQSLIIAGGAAGVAAAFNTPLGGLMFAFEELGKRKTMRHTSALLMAIVIAGLIALIVQGNYSYFGYSNATIDWQESWGIILIVAICSGIVGGLYGRLMISCVSRNNPVGKLRANRPYLFAFGCGLALSVLAFGLGQEVLGAGYAETKSALQDEGEMSNSFWFTKMLATLLSFASGAPGGVFSPTLTIGAGFGHFMAHMFAPEHTSVLMLMAMVGVLSAVTHCPITAFVIVLEMVDNHDLVLPLIFTSALASQVSRPILPVSVYHLLANQIRIPMAAQTTPTESPIPRSPAS